MFRQRPRAAAAARNAPGVGPRDDGGPSAADRAREPGDQRPSLPSSMTIAVSPSPTSRIGAWLAARAAGRSRGCRSPSRICSRPSASRFTWGSPIYRNFMPTEDAVLVDRLRRAGAIPIGKTNVPEFGLGSHTYNQVYGTTRNPYDLEQERGRLERRCRSGAGRRPAAARRRQRSRRIAAQSRPTSTTSSPCGRPSAWCRQRRRICRSWASR